MLVGDRDEKYVEAIEKLIGQKIGRRAMEGLPEEVPSQSRNHHSERRGGRRDRGRSMRHAEPTTRAPEAAKARLEPKELPAPRKEEIRPQAEARTTPVKQPEAAKAPDLSKFPAFLLRPVRLPAKQAKP
jgi:hypothetical protein